MVLSKAEEGEMFMPLKDWRKALKTPPSYRVGKNSQMCQIKLLGIVTGISLLLLFFFYSTEEEAISSSDHQFSNGSSSGHLSLSQPLNYDSTYPLTKPVYTQDTIHFKIGLVSDMDHSSKSKLESNTWISYYLQGTLVWNPGAKTVSVSFDKNNYKTLKTKFSHNGRGMELSELVTFNGKLLSFGDRTGLVFIIEDNNAYPWLLLTDGAGKTNKGFKTEWATVKNGYLYVGSMGKEWTSPQGELINYDPMFVKRISTNGEVVSLDWKDNYISLRSKLGVYFPGYMIHESGVWSEIHKKWFFLPRRMSHERYDEEKDEEMGTNVLLSCDEDFKNVKVVHIGEVLPTHGFSSFKFIPSTKDEVIVALRTEEYHGSIATYITAFDVHGTILMEETKVDDIKYEGYKAKLLPVTYVTYSPFGTHIASAQGDFVRMWVSSVLGKSIEFKPHLGTVRSVEFSRDGEKLLTSSNDKSIKIWITSRRRFFSSCTGHTNWVRIAKYSPDNKMIVSCSDDRTIRLWDPLTSKPIHTFNEVKGTPKYVTFHPSGTCFGAAMSHSVAKLYDVRNMKLLQYYACHSLPVNSIAFHPSGSYMITGSEDTTNKIIDLLEGRVILTLEAHAKPVTAVAFSKSGDHFATGSDDKNVFVWKSNLEVPVVIEETKRYLRESVVNNTETNRPKISVKASNLNISSSAIQDIYSVKDYEDTSSLDVERPYNVESYKSNTSNLDEADPSGTDDTNSSKKHLEHISEENNSTNNHFENPIKDVSCSKCSNDTVLALMETLTFENESLKKRVDLLEEKLSKMENMMANI